MEKSRDDSSDRDGVVIGILADYFEIPPHAISAETRFVDDLGFDSLQMLELLILVEEAAGVTLDIEHVRIETVRDVMDGLRSLANPHRSEPPPRLMTDGLE